MWQFRSSRGADGLEQRSLEQSRGLSGSVELTEISATISRHLFEWLDAPVYRLGAKDIPIAFSRILERATLPYEEDVLQQLRELAGY